MTWDPTAHPCTCRAVSHSPIKTNDDVGSSLRVQGGLNAVVAGQDADRFVPTRTGRPRWRTGRRRLAQVHPCACRAAMEKLAKTMGLKGSSLRVQGSPIRRGALLAVVRFTPARAGRPWRSWPRRWACRVHPCACRAARHVQHDLAPAAVHPCTCRAATLKETTTRMDEGSSLRVQGGPRRLRPVAQRTGFIPARAGRP